MGYGLCMAVKVAAFGKMGVRLPTAPLMMHGDALDMIDVLMCEKSHCLVSFVHTHGAEPERSGSAPSAVALQKGPSMTLLTHQHTHRYDIHISMHHQPSSWQPCPHRTAGNYLHTSHVS